MIERSGFRQKKIKRLDRQPRTNVTEDTKQFHALTTSLTEEEIDRETTKGRVCQSKDVRDI